MDTKRWEQVIENDPSADGRFVYAVLTTGIYCRPSCPSRPPRPENVRFFEDPASAEAAGYRACKRCRPNGFDAQRAAVIRVARVLLGSSEVPTVARLASEAGLAPSTFHRVFQQHTGVSPRAFAASAERERILAALERSQPVTDAAFDAGFRSSSCFYERSDALLGMPPGRWRAGGEGVEVRFAVGACSLGAVLVACSARGVVAIELGDDPDALVAALQDRLPNAELVGADPSFEALVARVVGQIEDPSLDAGLPLDVRGTAFQQRVWQALRRIPVGETRSYGEVAEMVERPGAARAVARACASNTLAVVIPCHRVVRRDGAMGGFRWGVERKQALLAREVPDP